MNDKNVAVDFSFDDGSFSIFGVEILGRD